MVREYIGARYVPKFMGTHDLTQIYEALCVVDNGLGTSYISKIPTPAGTPLTDTTYWAVYGASSGAVINLQNQIDEITHIGATPQMYGAKADGVTDDTQAIQDALDNNTTVYIPASNYPYIFTHLVFHEGQHVIGMGGVLKYKDNTAVDANTNYYPIWAVEDDTHVEGLIVDGNGSTNTTFKVCDIITFSGKNSTLTNCTFMNAADSGIMYSMAEDSIVSGNVVDGATDNGIYVNSGNLDDMKHFIVSNNVIANCTNSGIACKRQTTKGIIDANYIHDCNFGITMEPVSPYPSSSEISITNNYLYNIASYGIWVRAGENHVVSGNTIRGCIEYPIAITNSNNITVTGNLIDTSTTNSTAAYKCALYLEGDVATPEKCITATGNTFKINNNNHVIFARGTVEGVLFNSNSVIFTVANTSNMFAQGAIGGVRPTNITIMGNNVSDTVGFRHDIDGASLVCNNTGDCATYQPSTYQAVPALYLPVANDSVQGSGAIRVINPFRSVASMNGTVFKKYDVVLNQLPANGFEILVAKNDGSGSSVLTQLATVTF